MDTLRQAAARELENIKREEEKRKRDEEMRKMNETANHFLNGSSMLILLFEFNVSIYILNRIFFFFKRIARLKNGYRQVS